LDRLRSRILSDRAEHLNHRVQGGGLTAYGKTGLRPEHQKNFQKSGIRRLQSLCTKQSPRFGKQIQQVEKAYPYLRRFTKKPMNTDGGFFLLPALDFVRKAKNEPLPAEPDSMDELPQIDYSLLRQFPLQTSKTKTPTFKLRSLV
jgi:hypothetical protein